MGAEVECTRTPAATIAIDADIAIDVSILSTEMETPNPGRRRALLVFMVIAVASLTCTAAIVLAAKSTTPVPSADTTNTISHKEVGNTILVIDGGPRKAVKYADEEDGLGTLDNNQDGKEMTAQELAKAFEEEEEDDDFGVEAHMLENDGVLERTISSTWDHSHMNPHFEELFH
jgi:hypothetical protein